MDQDTLRDLIEVPGNLALLCRDLGLAVRHRLECRCLGASSAEERFDFVHCQIGLLM